MSKRPVLRNRLHAANLKNQFYTLLCITATVTRFIVIKVSDSEIRYSKLTRIVGLEPHVQYHCCFSTSNTVLCTKSALYRFVVMGPSIVIHFYSKTNKMHNFFFLNLLNITLLVWDNLSVRHQE